MSRAALRNALFAAGVALARLGARADGFVVTYDDAASGGEDFAENYYGFFASPDEAVERFGEFSSREPWRYRNVKLAMVIEERRDVHPNYAKMQRAASALGRPRDELERSVSDGLIFSVDPQAFAGADFFEAPEGFGPTPSAVVVTDVEKARLALDHLLKARDLLKEVGAQRTLARVRHAISSAKGAVRNVGYRAIRAQHERDVAQPGVVTGDAAALPEGADAIISSYRERSMDYRQALTDLTMLGMNDDAAHDALDEARQERTYPFTPETCPSKHWNGGDDYCDDCGENLQGSPDGKEG